MAKLDLASSEWCQLIFEGKNQAYGAYRIGRTGNQTGRDETGRTGCTSPSCTEEFY